MTVELIGIIALAIGLGSLKYDPKFIVYAFIFSTLLGSAAALILDSLGGTNISPAHLLLGFLAFRLMANRVYFNNALRGFAVEQPGFWLLLTTLYAVISAYVMPRIFQGQTNIFPVRAITGTEGSAITMPLAPAMSNLTQSVYLIGDFVCFFVLSGYAATHDGRRILGNALVACAVFNLAMAVLDLLTYYTGTTELMSFIRNANYALMSEAEVAGYKRIVGSFVEASSFGAATLGYFAFTCKLWLLGIRPRVTFPLTCLSLVALVFSTSTTAYVGLAGILPYFYLEVLLGATRRPMTRQGGLFVLAAPIILVVGAICIGLSDPASAYVKDLLDTMIFNKMSTNSGIERAMWNSQALQNILDTAGLGVGNGSLRASSFPISVLASFGIIGTPIFAMFFILVLLANSRAGEHDYTNVGYRQAAKSVCIAWLLTAAASGALTDLGLPFFVFAALTSAKVVKRPRPRGAAAELHDPRSPYVVPLLGTPLHPPGGRG
ncbi:hypothetical protein [Bradyrhizobium sp. NP1]|uniref:hypothetical protein n=1 Tax=Bradyrhizobium sp. NP1 TaxID=3049772 RepID=UPI0025A4D0A4|nr:hypothetical protein [Bradyrhizobium sp. NP1]WJR81406.1 hypothetical protein QOU61_17140 [Bradyrhizobium sp. NP1]